MKIIIDTNVLVRLVMRDDLEQSEIAVDEMQKASLIVITLPSLCEFVWVLERVYKLDKIKIVKALETILSVSKIQVDQAAVEKGIVFLNFGGDFADGIIAYSGQHLGGEVFVSFDKKAIAIANNNRIKAKLLTS